MEKIIHIADTDGDFIPEDRILRSREHLTYSLDHISTDSVNDIKERNSKKAQLLRKLYKTGKIHDVPYRIYYNSRNLEHVLYNEAADLSDEEKEFRADEFADQYEGKLQQFISMISSPELAAAGSYKNTWQYIETNCHSLERHTNMHLIFVNQA